MIDDPDYSRGLRGPGPVPGRTAWKNVLLLRRAFLAAEKLARTLLLECPAKVHCLAELDACASHAEAILLRFDRNGPPVDQTELNDMEATIRFIEQNPEQFVGVDVKGLKKEVQLMRNPPKGTTP